MTDHPGEALSAYLDDELDAAGSCRRRAHLRWLRRLPRRRRRSAHACAPSASVLVERDDHEPARDLWADVAGRLEAAPAAAGARVLPWYQRRWSVGIAELAVAASLVAAVTAGADVAQRAADAAVPSTSGPSRCSPQLEPVGTPEGAVTTVSFADAQFDAAVADLERVLREQRDSAQPADRARPRTQPADHRRRHPRGADGARDTTRPTRC